MVKCFLDDHHYATWLQYDRDQQTHSAAPPVQQVMARRIMTGTVTNGRMAKTARKGYVKFSNFLISCLFLHLMTH